MLFKRRGLIVNFDGSLLMYKPSERCMAMDDYGSRNQCLEPGRRGLCKALQVPQMHKEVEIKALKALSCCSSRRYVSRFFLRQLDGHVRLLVSRTCRLALAAILGLDVGTVLGQQLDDGPVLSRGSPP